MAANGKKLFGAGIVVAGMLALAASGVFTHHQPAPSPLKQDFAVATAPAAQKPMARAGWDYSGADDAASFKTDVSAIEKTKPVFVMLHGPDCPHCQDLTAQLHQIQDQHLAPTDFDVVLVDIYRFPGITRSLMQGHGVPETHVYYGGDKPVVFSGAPETVQPLLDLMQQIQDIRAQNGTTAPAPKPGA